MVFVYHVQGAPWTRRTETNALNAALAAGCATRVQRIKPSHLAGGYGQHAFAFQLPGSDR